MFQDKPLHDWSSHGADEFRCTAIIEHLMSNEADQPLTEQEEANSDIYD